MPVYRQPCFVGMLDTAQIEKQQANRHSVSHLPMHALMEGVHPRPMRCGRMNLFSSNCGDRGAMNVVGPGLHSWVLPVIDTRPVQEQCLCTTAGHKSTSPQASSARSPTMAQHMSYLVIASCAVSSPRMSNISKQTILIRLQAAWRKFASTF